MSTNEVQDWLPGCHARLHFTRASTATPGTLWDAAQKVRLRDAPRLNRLVRWRLGKHAPSPDMTFEEFFRTGIFMLLEEGERLSISGVAGKIWAPSGDYAQFETAGDYREYRQRGTAKVVLKTEVREHERGSQIVNEARIWCADRRTQLIFRSFWTIVRPFARFIYSEGFAVAVKQAEAQT
ncbi:MAG TPA: hypothetical protein VH247_11285 [Thermoleophilaceae bacterium]|nr:hypothetical protein [Thermoleophilaceae bacterium]